MYIYSYIHSYYLLYRGNRVGISNLPVKCQDFKLPYLSASTPTIGVAKASITCPEKIKTK